MGDMELFTLREVADKLRVTPRCLYVWHSKQKLRFVKIGGRNKITGAELTRFLQAEGMTGELAAAGGE